MTSSLIDVLKGVFKKSTLGGGYGVITGSAALQCKRAMPLLLASSPLWAFVSLSLPSSTSSSGLAFCVAPPAAACHVRIGPLGSILSQAFYE